MPFTLRRSAMIRTGSIPILVLVTLALTAATCAVAYTGRLGTARAALTASVRGILQLLAVSLAIVAVLTSLWLAAGFILLMGGVAVLTAGRRGRLTAGRPLVSLPLAAGVAPVLALLLVSGLLPVKPVSIVPVAGILIGGAMTVTGQAMRLALDGLDDRRGEYEARLALGFLPVTARRDLCRPIAAQALWPALDQTRTAGLVTLPGAFVGVLLGGASPMQAGLTQILVLVGLLTVQSTAVLGTVELISRGRLRREVAPAD